MRLSLLVILINIVSSTYSQKQSIAEKSIWRAEIKRNDGNNIAFNFEKVTQNNKTVLYIKNAAERLLVDSVQFKGDSVFIKMPLFESEFRAEVSAEKWEGIWVKGTSRKEQVLPFTAEKSNSRFMLTDGPAKVNVSGRWSVKFSSEKSKEAVSIAEFNNRGNILTGTFITPTGDDRFLEGVVTGNKLKMSGFDGGHAILFVAEVIDDQKIVNGHLYSGATSVEEWSAVKNPKAKVKPDESAMYLRKGESHLNFQFPDLNKNLVSIGDERFKNKVVIIQLMGSWCPNCMDETQFLSEYYNKNKERGVEVIALAYEYSSNFERSQKSLQKFQQRFQVKYPLLITGVTVSDSLRTEKTLPELTPIKVFPSSIILDKQGKVRKLDNGFYGPGTGEHFIAYKKEFYKTIDELLAE